MNHPVVGGRGYDSPDLHESLTLLPRVLLGSRVRLPGDTSIALLAGTTQIVSGAMGGHSIFPFPTGAVEIETRFGSHARYGVRAGVRYMRWIYGDPRSFTWGT
jgi:hypothetical protein